MCDNIEMDVLNMPNALVTGAKGHTGSYLCQLLTDKGWDVVGTDLPPKKRKDLMKKETVFRTDLKYIDIETMKGVKFIPADLTDKESLRILFKQEKYDVIFHPASFYDYFALIDILRKINVEGLRNLLDIILEECDGIIPRFIHWSTCGVYGEADYKYDPKTKYPIAATEEAGFNPPNPYSISKMEQEQLITEYKQTLKDKFPYTIIRSAPIYGPHQMYGAFHIMYMFNKFGHMVKPSVYPRRKRLMMPMIHIETLVEAAYFLSQNEKSIGEIYNVIEDALPQEVWMEYLFNELGITYTIVPVLWGFYKFVAKLLYNMVLKQNKKAREYGIRPKIDLSMADYTTHQYYFSNQKLKDLGFKLKYDSYSGTRQTVRWYRDHGWLESEEYPEAKQ
jgi:nucleoside-diphosphate-sugar epimerase